jgi:hypothetical protein
MEGKHEQNEYGKNPKTNLAISAKRINSNWTPNEEIGGKYDTTGPNT